MKRVLVIGCCGSGKSTFSKKLSEKLNIETIHLDQYYWKKDWVETDNKEWREKVKELAKKDEWIMDGNYGGTFDIRFPKADMIILLDNSKWVCLYRVIKRIIKYNGKVRPDMPDGCRERFDRKFLKYVYSFNNDHQPIIDSYLSLFTHKQQYILKSNKASNKFIETFCQ